MENLKPASRPVRPISPVAPYIGGKKVLAKTIVPLLDSIDHTIYAEPFVGMGGIFLRRSWAAPSEVMNDYSRDVSGFFRVLQRHYTAFLDMLRYQLTMRAEFERLLAVDPGTLTDLERAARFLYLQRLAFGGRVAGRNFGVDPGSSGHFDVTRLGPLLEALHERLSGVVIECLPWDAFITRYDRPGTLFYLDPPYYGCETDYGTDLFSRDQFERMADLLDGINGSFVLSLNATPETRTIFARFDQQEVNVTYTVGGGNKTQNTSELIISRAKVRRLI
jgi:DNA adenine methylase